MAAAVSKALGLLPRAIKKIAGETVTYRRGALSVPLTAVPTATQFELHDDGGSVIAQSHYRDWLIAAADLVIAGEETLPKTQDYLEWADADGTVHTFDVTAPPGVELWRYTDSNQAMLRVHTLLKKRG